MTEVEFEALAEQFCDGFCKYPDMRLSEEEMRGRCEECPLNRIEKEVCRQLPDRTENGQSRTPVPTKLADAEIKKALEWYVSKFKTVGFVYMDADGTKLVSTQEVLDLINRLQADVDNYKQIAENQQKIILDKAFENKKLKADVKWLDNDNDNLIAENERLTAEIERLKNER